MARTNRTPSPPGPPVYGRGWISQRYKPEHKAWDFAVRINSPVYAFRPGVVRVAGRFGGMGLAVVHEGPSGVFYAYGHNSRIVVEVGDRVVRGQQIARSGRSGRAGGPHVHFAAWKGTLSDRTPFDPFVLSVSGVRAPDSDGFSAEHSSASSLSNGIRGNTDD